MTILTDFKTQIIYDILGVFPEVLKNGTVVERVESGYTPGPGGGPTYTETSYPMQYVQKSYMTEELNENVLPGDGKFIILANSVTIEPKSGWYILTASGDRWDIKEADPKPVDYPVVFICQGRKGVNSA
jgi:hypothetical protein